MVAWGRAGDGGPTRRPRNRSPAESSAPWQGRRIVVPQAFQRPYRGQIDFGNANLGRRFALPQATVGCPCRGNNVQSPEP